MSITSLELILPIAELVANSISRTKQLSDSTDLALISDEENRQAISLQMAERQAKVSQEIAIANRIETADEVEIEEFYDVSGEGNLGLKTDGQSLSVGLGGKGKKVIKRVYRFKSGKPEITKP